MNTNAIGAPSALDQYGYLAAASGQKDTEDMFLNLLVTQLRNQNPLEPLENGQFIQQMSSFAAVEQTSKLAASIETLIALQEVVAGQNAFTQSAALVGKVVEYDDPESGASGTGMVGSVRLTDTGLLLQIDGKDVPLSAVTGLIAPDAPPPEPGGDPAGDGDESDDTNESNESNS